MHNMPIAYAPRILMCLKNMCLLFLIGCSYSFAGSLDNAIEISEKSFPAPLIERSKFMARKSIREMGLSPDGAHIYYVLSKVGRSELWLLDIDNQQHRKLFSSKDIEDTLWSNDSQFLFIQTKNGLSGISILPGKRPELIINLDSNEDEYFYGVDHSQAQAVIVSLKQQRSTVHDLVRIKSDGSKQVLYTDPSRVIDYVIAKSGQLKVIKQLEGDSTNLFDISSNQVKLIRNCKFDDICSLQSFDEKNGLLYLIARFEENLGSLYSLNTTSNELELVHQDPKARFDLSRGFYDINGLPKLTRYNDHFISHYSLDQEIQGHLDKMNELINNFKKHQAFLYMAPDKYFKRWLVFDYGPMNQGRDVYLYDSETQLVSEPFETLVSSNEFSEQFIQQQYIAQKVQVEYQVSDGMKQFGYVTLPLGKKVKEVPLVVVPHGGPWSRVKGHYSSIIQFLANRGYAVFEPNFRSSTGMGRHYVLSANKDFGDGIVQHDIIDGMRYVLSQGIGDPNKLAMFGHSFGGFSTLAALAFTPNLFKVGIAGAPPSNLANSIKQLSENKQNEEDKIWQIRLMKLGVDLTDPQELQRLSAQSPDSNWQKVNKPLYLLAGGKDDRVAITGVRDYAIRLEHAEKPISLLVDGDEGHSFNKDIAREAYAYVLEKALAKHLGGVYQQEVSENLKRYLKRKMLIDKNGVLDSVH